MANKIKYIIDYIGYGNIFDLTNTRTGEHNEITRDIAMDYIVNLNHKTFFSVRAEVALKALKQVEVKNDTLIRRLEGVLL